MKNSDALLESYLVNLERLSTKAERSPIRNKQKFVSLITHQHNYLAHDLIAKNVCLETPSQQMKLLKINQILTKWK
jgi:hypothetical protein